MANASELKETMATDAIASSTDGISQGYFAMRQQGVVCGMVISRIVGRGLSQVKGGIPVRKSLYGTGQDSATCVGRIKKRSFLHW